MIHTINPNAKTLIAAIFVLILSGCASGGIKLSDEFPQYKYSGQKFGAVLVSLTPELQSRLQKERSRFDSEWLNQAIRNALDTRGLYDASAGHSVEVVLSDVYVISLGMATLGVLSMGQNERLVGTVKLKQTPGQMFGAFEISSSYGGGGAGGAWALYDHFGELTAQAILGEITSEASPASEPNAPASR